MRLLLLLPLVASLLTLHLVATRSAVSQVSTADDARLRRAGARRVLAAAQLVVGSTLAGVLLVTGTALRNASTSGYDAGEGWVASTDPVVHALGVAGLVAAPVVLVATLVVTGVALTRASQVAGVVVTRRRSGTVVADDAAPAHVTARHAATAYVRTARAAGLTPEETLDLVRGALLT
ncbi:MAG: hypothetical protein IR158_08220 [Cellulomonas sp.]|uniref:hypothetical protein n=1 Tax=Cellulomonas sp. TaxID=40001 RepID=UPI0019EE188D|nr:hypothetical protein [Cellulomonas sp.]MBF0687733.1 hypothetical protein [Cellulomonas sp.]